MTIIASARKGLQRGEVTPVILGVIGAAGLLALLSVSPAVLAALGAVAGASARYNRRRYINTAVKRLADRGLLEFRRNSRGIFCVRLTNRGQAELKKYELKNLQLPRPKKWDGKFRLIMFDIKEWKRGTRDALRVWLEHLGFVRLQNSVWVYPHECREVITLLKAHFGIGREVLYATAENIENDKWLRREFHLF